MTDYYVDATAGNDGDNGLSELTAWQTISKVNTESFNPGDRIRFKRAEVWREQLVADQDGASGTPILYMAYGTGADPVINGSDLVVGWTNTVGEEYSASVATTPNAVWEDGESLSEGAAIGALNQGEWKYDGGANELHVRATDGADPDTHTMESGTRIWCLRIVADYNDYEDIKLEKSNTVVLDIDAPVGGPAHVGFNFTRVTISHPASIGAQLGHQAVDRVCPNEIVFEDCVIEFWDRTEGEVWAGIHGRLGDGTGLQNVTIRNCLFRSDIAYGVDTNLSRNAITLDGAQDPLIEWNEITGCDHGIVLTSGSTGWIVRWNWIHDTGDDGIFYHEVDDASGLTYGNVLHRVSDNFIDLQAVAAARDFGRFFNNACYECVNFGMSLRGPDGTRAEIKNNIFGINGDAGTRFFIVLNVDTTIDMNDFDIDRNIYYDFTLSPGTAQFANFQSGDNRTLTEWRNDFGLDLTSEAADPQFLNRGGGAAENYAVLASSPAIDEGLEVGLELDYAGVSIPQGSAPDIGAFELETPSAIISHGTSKASLDFMNDLTEIDEFWEDYFANAEIARSGISKMAPVED